MKHELDDYHVPKLEVSKIQVVLYPMKLKKYARKETMQAIFVSSGRDGVTFTFVLSFYLSYFLQQTESSFRTLVFEQLLVIFA